MPYLYRKRDWLLVLTNIVYSAFGLFIVVCAMYLLITGYSDRPPH